MKPFSLFEAVGSHDYETKKALITFEKLQLRGNSELSETIRKEIVNRNYRVLALFKNYYTDQNPDTLIGSLKHIYADLNQKRSFHGLSKPFQGIGGPQATPPKQSQPLNIQHSAHKSQDSQAYNRNNASNSNSKTPSKTSKSAEKSPRTSSKNLDSSMSMIGRQQRNINGEEIISDLRKILSYDHSYEEIRQKLMPFVDNDTLNLESFKVVFKISVPGFENLGGEEFNLHMTYLFNLFDKDKDGEITDKEMEECLKFLFINKKQKDPAREKYIDSIFGTMDYNSNYYLYYALERGFLLLRDFEGFLLPLYKKIAGNKSLDKVKEVVNGLALQCFRNADYDKNGKVALYEFQKFAESDNFKIIDDLISKNGGLNNVKSEKSSSTQVIPSPIITPQTAPSQTMPSQVVPSQNLPSQVTPSQIVKPQVITPKTTTPPATKKEINIPYTIPLQITPSKNIAQEIPILNNNVPDKQKNGQAKVPTLPIEVIPKKEVMKQINMAPSPSFSPSPKRDQDNIQGNISSRSPGSKLSKKKTDLIEKKTPFDKNMKEIKKFCTLSGLSRVNSLKAAQQIKKKLSNTSSGVDKEGFIKLVFSFYEDERLTSYQRSIREDALTQIFGIVDEDHNGVASKRELAYCISLACGGTPYEKIQAGFLLFDFNNSNTLDFEELTEYFGTLFRISFLNNPEIEIIKGLKVDHRQLAEVTAEKLFTDLLLDPETEIHQEEFLEWCYGSRKKMGNDRSELIAKHKPASKKDTANQEKEKASKQLKDFLNDKAFIAALLELRNATGLHRIFVQDALLFFKITDKNGFLNKTQFTQTIYGLLKKFKLDTKVSKNQLDDILMKIFLMFDVQKNGVVDIDYIAMSCAFLCKGNFGDKVKILFTYYDDNGDGLISYDELLKYFSSFFKLSIKLLDKNFQLFDVEKVAEETVSDCFKYLKLDKATGKINEIQFRSWSHQI